MTEYQIDLILRDLATNAESPDYTERTLSRSGNKVTCMCLVTSQIHNTSYPRYSITWDTSQEDGYIQASYHFHPKVGAPFVRIAKIFPADLETGLVEQKITSALLSGLRRGKAIYDGATLGPYDENYRE